MKRCMKRRTNKLLVRKQKFRCLCVCGLFLSGMQNAECVCAHVCLCVEEEGLWLIIDHSITHLSEFRQGGESCTQGGGEGEKERVRESQRKSVRLQSLNRGKRFVTTSERAEQDKRDKQNKSGGQRDSDRQSSSVTCCPIWNDHSPSRQVRIQRQRSARFHKPSLKIMQDDVERNHFICQPERGKQELVAPTVVYHRVQILFPAWEQPGCVAA